MEDANQELVDGEGKRSRTDLSAISVTQRAAVILAILGKEAGKRLLNRLDDSALSTIRSELERMPYFRRAELLDIIADFVAQVQESSEAFIGGRAEVYELTEELERDRVVEFKTVDIEFETADIEPSQEEFDDVWSELAKRDPSQTGAYLGSLTPSLIAMILRKLPTLLCSEILNQLDDEKLRPVMAHLVEPEADDPALDAVVGRMVELEYLNTPQSASEDSNEQLEAIGEILSLVPSERRDSLMEFLQQEHGEKLSLIERSLFTLETLPDTLPRAAIPVVFREMDMNVTVRLIASLQGKYSEVADYILSNISARLAGLVKEELADQSPVSQEEIDDIHREFIGRLMDLRRSGKIEIHSKAAA